MASLITSPSAIWMAVKDAFFGSPTAPLRLQAMTRPLIPSAVCRAAGVNRLAELGRREVKEINVSDLYDEDAFVHRLREAIEGHELLWVFSEASCERISDLLERYPALITPLNEEKTSWGINVYKMISFYLSKNSHAIRRLSGVDVSSTPVRLRLLLHEHHVPVRRSSLPMRIVRDPRTWVYAAIFIYSCLRALPVIFVPQFHGSILVLWLIDVVTAIPYTWGVLAMVTSKRIRQRLAGTLIAIITFLAPYFYFWTHGSDYPLTVTITVTVMIVGSFSVEALRFRQERRLERLYGSE
ncbi:hypothetical protein [Schaalia sp. lx-260]|uniref:hypothetical protein n=1 Tax=Schaalia sp. lx-260 TaxID=2899082 RepID=UPI001E57FDF4|nr:hypothetical protein [Schaalia sp. lx-260]MCD4549349.1 hypothetical protein [Schaalia sp. lx-260]